ncbi:MAG: alanine racemase [Roseburia sp.]|nr:alanine racemase [Roseburia sp.]
MQLVIDLSRLRHNIRRFRALTGNGFCAVVKSQAYGHGAAIVCYIEPLVDWFLVATYEEAAEIAPIVKKPVLVLGGEIAPFLRKTEPNVIPTVFDACRLGSLLKSGCRNFSVAVNTGMNRLGANEKQMEAIKSLCRMYGVRPWSVYSHLYDGVRSAEAQSREFDRLTGDAILQKRRHLYCSCALDMRNAELYDAVRCGIAMYGYADGMDICMKARAKIVSVFKVCKGGHVGYGDHTVDRDSYIATVRCGYADGLRRCEKPMYMRVRGVKCPIVGMPCMDLCMIDVTDIRCRVGEYAYLIEEKSDAEYLADCYGTIIYEVLTGFNGRAERIYI